MKKVLVIGGGGFIGYHLSSNLLDGGVQVDLFDDFSRGIEDRDLKTLCSRKGAKMVRRNVLDTDSLAGLPDDYDVIFHLAAIVGVRNVVERPFAVLRENVEMVFRVIDFARQQRKLSRLVFTSTSEVYAGTLLYFQLPLPTPEETPLAITPLDSPRTSYMLSKICGEALLNQAGIPFTILRPHNVYGPRMGLSHVIPEQLFKAHQAEEGGQLETYSLEQTRTFCYIEDAVNMMRIAAERKECAGVTLNVGVQEPEITIGELADIIVRVVDKRLTVLGLPSPPGSPARRCPDMRRTIGLTDYRPGVSIEEGVRRTYRWYRESVFEGKGLSAL